MIRFALGLSDGSMALVSCFSGGHKFAVIYRCARSSSVFFNKKKKDLEAIYFFGI